MARGYFITGTDTGVGKSCVSVALLRALQRQGLCVVGMKPVASGCEETADGLRNEDALLLQQYASLRVDYDLINPYAFAPAIAPHLAAKRAGVTIEFAPILERFRQLQEMSEAVIVEGAGGWLVPLNDQQSIADLATALQLPVIIVVAIRLGCINHALLTAQAVRASGCTLAGWIANHTRAASAESAETIDAIAARIGVPLLEQIDHAPQGTVEHLADAITLGSWSEWTN
jgi:dethiobiotin synthetase